jgi:outer membrane protein assembly factor BamA
LQYQLSVRSIVVLCVCVAAAAGVVFHELPEGEAVAEPHASRPQEVQSVSLDGHDLPVTALRSVLATHTGDLLDSTKLATDRAALEAALIARGFLAARVQAAQVMFDSGGGAYVTYQITPGAMFHVRDVRVVGAPERDTGIVTIARGEIVNTERIEQARDALATRLAARGRAASVAIKLESDVLTRSVDVVLVTN